MKGTTEFKTDSLINVDEIVEKYNSSLKNDQNHTKPGQQIWSEPMDDIVKFSPNKDNRTSNINQSVFNVTSNKLFDEIKKPNSSSSNISLTSKLDLFNDFDISKNVQIDQQTNLDLDFKDLSNKTKDLSEKLNNIETKIQDSIISKNLDKIENNITRDQKRTKTLSFDSSNELEQPVIKFDEYKTKTIKLNDKINDIEQKLDNLEASSLKTKNTNLIRTSHIQNETKSNFDELIENSFKSNNPTSQVIHFTNNNVNEEEKVTKTDVKGYTNIFFNDNEDLTTNVNNNQFISFENDKQKTKKKFLGFFQKKNLNQML